MFEELRPHLIELRKRLFISIVSVFVCFGICFTFWNPLLAWMSEPLKQVLPAGSNIIFTQIQEPFFTAMKVAFFAGLVLALPIIFWQFWLFVAPGLYDNEKKYVIPFVLSASFMFACGAAFCYYVVIPLGFTFLVNFGGQLFTALPSIGEYVGFFTKLLIGFGISFELPVITLFQIRSSRHFHLCSHRHTARCYKSNFNGTATHRTLWNFYHRSQKSWQKRR